MYFTRLVIRNESINQKYKGGMQAFIAEHGGKYNNDIAVIIFMAPDGIETLRKNLKREGLKWGRILYGLTPGRYAGKNHVVKAIPFKVQWLKGLILKTVVRMYR